MAYAFFISERYLKQNTPMGDNVDVKDIYPFAKSAEDTYIQQALGSCFYDRLVASRLASPADTTSDEETVLLLVRDALVWYTCYDALPFVWFKIRNIGLVKQTKENSESASVSDMSFLQKQLKNKADMYLKKLQDYLCQNSRLFPDYNCGCSSCSSSGPNTNVGPSSALAFDRNDNNDNDYVSFYKKWLR